MWEALNVRREALHAVTEAGALLAVENAPEPTKENVKLRSDPHKFALIDVVRATYTTLDMPNINLASAEMEDPAGPSSSTSSVPSTSSARIVIVVSCRVCRQPASKSSHCLLKHSFVAIICTSDAPSKIPKSSISEVRVCSK